MSMRVLLARWETLLIIVLIGTFFVGSQLSQYFLTSSNISIALAGVTPAALLALTMTLIIITGNIDISVGSMVGLCAATMALSLENGVPIGFAMAAGLLVGLMAGALNGALVAFAGLPSLVVTIGTLALYRGAALVLLEERGISGFPGWYESIGFGTVPGTPMPWSTVIFIPCFIGFALFLHRTHWGRALYAIGNNIEASAYSGVNVKRLLFGIFVASGAMASLSSTVLTAYLASARADTGLGLEFIAITAVVLGGVSIFGGSGTMVGVLIAVLILAFVQNSMGLAGVTPEQQQIATGGVLVMTLVIFSRSEIIRKVAMAFRRRRKP